MAATTEPKIVGVAPLFANRFSVTLNPVIARIALGEVVDGQVNYHTVVVAPTEDAAALATLIMELLDRMQMDRIHKEED